MAKSGFRVKSDGTPGGTTVFYVTEDGKEVQINCCNEMSIKMTGDDAFYQINLLADLVGLDLEVDRKQVYMTRTPIQDPRVYPRADEGPEPCPLHEGENNGYDLKVYEDYTVMGNVVVVPEPVKAKVIDGEWLPEPAHASYWKTR